MAIEIQTRKHLLPKTLSWGFLKVLNAGALPADQVWMSESPSELAVTIGRNAVPFQMRSSIHVKMCRGLDACKEFKKRIKNKCKGAPKRMQTMEGVWFSPEMLRPSGVPKEWKHEMILHSEMIVAHLFTGQEHALHIMFIGEKLLSDPLLAHFVENLRVLPDAWETQRPRLTVTAEEEKRRKAIQDHDLPADTKAERREAIVRAAAMVGVKEEGSPEATVEALQEHVLKLVRAKERMSEEERQNLAMDLGSLWGEMVCKAAGWRWRVVSKDGGEGMFSVVSPGNRQMMMPIVWMRELLLRHGEREQVPVVVQFSLIYSGEAMPAGEEGEYVDLGCEDK